MSLLLYGIIAEDVPVLLEPELHLIKAAGLAAIIKTCEMEVSREPAVVLAYGEQIKQLHQQTTLIPIRYGSQLSDAAAVAAHLLSQQAHYYSRLTMLNGCEEMGIRLTLKTLNNKPSSTAKSGYEYLLARKRAYTVPEYAEQQAALLNQGLAGLYRLHSAELGMLNGQPTYLLSYLVSRTDLPAFCKRLYALAESNNETGCISGPWPPYNFAK